MAVTDNMIHQSHDPRIVHASIASGTFAPDNRPFAPLSIGPQDAVGDSAKRRGSPALTQNFVADLNTLLQRAERYNQTSADSPKSRGQGTHCLVTGIPGDVVTRGMYAMKHFPRTCGRGRAGLHLPHLK